MIAALLSAFVVQGCSSGVTQYIRERDFRAYGRAQEREKASPEPISDVMDMAGWSTDLDGALAFGGVNGQYTALFLYRSGDSSSEKAKGILNSESVAPRLPRLRVAVDAGRNSQATSRYPVSQLPAVLLLAPGGAVTAQSAGTLTKSQVLQVLAR